MRTVSIPHQAIRERFQDERLHQHQWEFAITRAAYPLAMGAQGSGKSRGLIYRALNLSADTPYFGNLEGNRGIIGRYARTDLVDTTMRDFFEVVPDDWVAKYPTKPNYECILINGSTIQFVPLEDLFRFKSRNLGWAGIEEIDEIDDKIWEEIAFNRLRRTTTATGNIVDFHTCFAVCNPTAGWVYDVWGVNEEKLESKYEEERKEFDPDFLTIHSSTYDNREHLPEGYIERREKHFGGPHSKKGKMFLMGQWGSTENDVYPWSEDLVHDKDIWPPLEWETIVGLDHGWGTRGVTAMDFMALEPLEVGRTRVHVYDEIDLTPESLETSSVDIASAVKSLDETLQYHAIKRAEVSGVIAPERLDLLAITYDPSMKAKMQKASKEQPDKTIIETYQERSVELGLMLPFVPGNNVILVGIDRIVWLMQNGLIKWNPRCTNSRRAHKNYVWDPNQENKPKRGQKDHHCDCVRYGCMFMNMLYHLPMEQPKMTRIERIKQKRREQYKKVRQELEAVLI